MGFYNSKLDGSTSANPQIGSGTRTIRGMVAAGADLMTNMYDIKVWFPNSAGKPDSNPFKAYPITVRATSFEIKDIETPTYDVKYHGLTLKRPKTEINFDRMFDIEFREDAAFDLRKKFTAWHMAVSDPVTGGVSNATSFFGKISVGTIAGEYYATTVAPPTAPGQKDGILNKEGHISNQINPIAVWSFYNVWVYKVGGVKFNTEGADPNKFTVSFCFMDCDFPQYGGNALTTDDSTWSWDV
jgi:hypothetical protein